MSQSAHLLSTAQVAELLGKSTATVKRMALAGTLPPAMKLPGETGAYLFRVEDVEALRTAS
jgi:excisionase family DNA binding protein